MTLKMKPLIHLVLWSVCWKYWSSFISTKFIFRFSFSVYFCRTFLVVSIYLYVWQK